MSELAPYKYTDENEFPVQEANWWQYEGILNEESTVSHGSDLLGQRIMDNNHTKEKIDPEEFVRENRSRIIAVVRSSDDPFTRACAWALLDKHTSNADLDELHKELDAIAEQGDSK